MSVMEMAIITTVAAFVFCGWVVWFLAKDFEIGDD